MQNTNRHIEYYDRAINLTPVGSAIGGRAQSLARRHDVELTVACLVVAAVAKTLVGEREFCCSAGGMDYIENLSFADPICIQWQRHDVDGTVRACRTLTSPQNLTLAELAEILQPNSTDDEQDGAPLRANELDEPAFIIRHCDDNGSGSDLGPTSAVAALLVSGGTIDGGQLTTGSASNLTVRLAYDRRIITTAAVRRFLAAVNQNFSLTALA